MIRSICPFYLLASTAGLKRYWNFLQSPSILHSFCFESVNRAFFTVESTDDVSNWKGRNFGTCGKPITAILSLTSSLLSEFLCSVKLFLFGECLA